MKKAFTPSGRLGAGAWLLAALLFMLSRPVSAQDREISGSVTDSKGTPVLAATVVVKGTTTGTTTTAKGTFRLKVPAGAQALVISYIGMRTQEVPIEKNKKVYNVRLEDEATGIEELVVVGYGTMAKKDLTGAVSSVSGKTLNEIPMTNTASALTGRLAGVQITTTDGSPDADVKIRIRGGGSITQDNSPLYIVDGFPVDRISDIPATDIQSIDVLKDASSTAIYGARGANGVIIVTTKNAKAGRTTVTYNGYGQFKYVPKMMDMMDSYEFVRMQYELAAIKGASDLESFTNHYGDPTDFDIYREIPAQNTQERMYGRTAWGQSHNVSINGGSEKTKFNLSLTHLSEDGVLLESDYQRTNVNFKLNHQLYKGLRADVSAFFTHAVVHGAGTSSNTSTEIRNAVNYRPVIGKGSLSDGITADEMAAIEDIEARSSLYDPVELIGQDYREEKRTDLNVNGAISWDIVKNLTLRSEFGIIMRNTNTRRYYGPLTWKAINAGGQPLAEMSHKEAPRWRTSHTLTYKLTSSKDHSLTVMGGFEAMSEETTTMSITARNLPQDMDKYDVFARMSYGSQEYPVTSESCPTRLASFFGRANYSFRDKYLVSATVRADGSTKFAPGNRWGVFPSGAVAWRISQEGFMKNVSWLDDLKLRFSIGAAGNNRIDNDLWRRTFIGTFDNRTMYAGLNNIPNLYFTNPSGTLPDPKLKWETTITRNLGLDFAILGNRLTGSAELYWNTTKDLLLKAVLPEHTGYNDQQRNVGQTSNRGFELSLNGVIVDKKDFSLTATFNIAFNRNRVDKLNEGTDRSFYQSNWQEVREKDDYLVQVGQPIGLMYGYVTDGFYTIDDYMDGEGNWELKPGVANSQGVTGSLGGKSGCPLVGSLKLKKLTGISDPNDKNACMVTTLDRTVIGNANPKHSGGLNIAAAYKGIDFSVFFNWVYGNDIYNAQKIINSNVWKYAYYNLSDDFNTSHRFRIFDDAGNDLRTDKEALRELNKNATIWSPLNGAHVLHSWAVEDGSFLRLSNITLGYTLPQKWTRKIGMSKCRFYVTANNLWIWTNYSGFDPEVDTRRSTPLTPGVDYSAYPKTRSFTFGANITF